jgi:hypothetical protein
VSSLFPLEISYRHIDLIRLGMIIRFCRKITLGKHHRRQHAGISPPPNLTAPLNYGNQRRKRFDTYAGTSRMVTEEQDESDEDDLEEGEEKRSSHLVDDARESNSRTPQHWSKEANGNTLNPSMLNGIHLPSPIEPKEERPPDRLLSNDAHQVIPRWRTRLTTMSCLKSNVRFRNSIWRGCKLRPRGPRAQGYSLQAL